MAKKSGIALSVLVEDVERRVDALTQHIHDMDKMFESRISILESAFSIDEPPTQEKGKKSRGVSS